MTGLVNYVNVLFKPKKRGIVMKRAWKRLCGYGILSLMLLVCVICLQKPTKTYALSVTPVNVKMYTTSGTPVFAAPDLYSGVVVYMERFVNVTVTGITDNGFYQVDLNGNYYIPGPYLVGQIEPVKTEKQKILENLEDFAEAYRIQLGFMKDYSTSFGLLDVTGDGIPELFDLSGKEIYTYHNGRAVMMYYSEYPLTFYYSKKDNMLLGKYTWNETEIWEVYFKDVSLYSWGQLKCFSTDASLYKKNATAVPRSYVNDDLTRADMYNILKNIMEIK